MARTLPPLNALRAFEAAARNLSFLKAAEELHVTPGAVSQQVRTLEAQIGVPLFRRLTRGVLLTDAGQRFGKRIGELFDGIAAATQEVKRDGNTAGLTIGAVPSFAARWLIPRLGSFRLAHPGTILRVVADTKLVDFTVDDIDAAIRFGAGDYPGLITDFLFREEIFPVCSPKLLNGPIPLKRLEDLSLHTLLDDEPDPGNNDLIWNHWLEAVGGPAVELKPTLRFTFTHMSLQAAVASQGVALGTSVLAADDLASGSLVRPFPESTTSKFAYWFVCPESSVGRPKIRAFRDWIRSQAMGFLATPTASVAARAD